MTSTTVSGNENFGKGEQGPRGGSRRADEQATAAFATLVERSRAGGVLAALLAALLAYAGRTGPLPALSIVLLAYCTVFGLVRVALAVHTTRSGRVGRAWRTAYRVSVLATALGWGMALVPLTARGRVDTALLSLMVTAGLAAGGVTTLSSEVWLARSYLALLLLPVTISEWTGTRENGPWVAAGIVAYFAYLIAQSAAHRRDFLRRTESETLLNHRAERLLLERQRAELAQQRADEANEAKSTFLANMSHELRTPLTAIIGYAEQLLGSPTIDTRIEYAEIIRRNGEHLLEIINDILDMSKIEAGKMSVAMQSFSLRSMLAEVASLMRPRATKKGLNLDVCAETPFPSAITLDETRTRQILLNLVGNAIKFTSRGSVLIKVRFLSDVQRLQIDVVDTGPGMSDDAVQRLFTPFSQAAESQQRAQGTGLGLSISRRLARMMRGDISVRSVLGFGSTFTMDLPVEAAFGSLVQSVHPSLRPLEPAVTTPYQSALRGVRVLLAEDGPDNQRLIVAMLEQAGANVTVVGDGEAAVVAALHGLATDPYDVVLLDMEMPKLDGYGAAARLRATGFTSPIVALTAHAMEDHKRRTLASGCDDHLVKPINRLALVDAIVKRLPVRDAPESPQLLLQSSLPDDDILSDLVPKFIDSLRVHTVELQAALEKDDRHELVRIAHQLRGAGGGYGYSPITWAATELHDAMESDAVVRRAAVERLVSLCSSAIAARDRR